MTRGNKGFTNKAKSGARALPSRWRQAAQQARADRRRPAPKPKPKRAR